MNTPKSSQLQNFYKKSVLERQTIISDTIDVGENDLFGKGMSIELADSMVENVVTVYGLPFGIATNFLINDRDYLVPMVTEEPSVIAAASYAAKLFRRGGGFRSTSDRPVMIGQIQILDLEDLASAAQEVVSNKKQLISLANETAGSIVRRGGGVLDIELRTLPESRVGPMLVVHVLIDTRDAMGANVVNTVVEHIAPEIERLTGGRVHLRILSNLSDLRKARASGTIPASELTRDGIDGYEVAKSIVEAAVFAEIDPYRAATHNKGVMNGIDAVVIATGNDWRAIEAGAHAFAARSGSYTSLTRYSQTPDGDLYAEIEMPLAVGIVGGATRVHPTAQAALKILNVQSATELAEVIACVGLAQNFAALRALSSEGIQRGHMRLHARQLAIAAGASLDQVDSIVSAMTTENNIRLERAQQLVETFKKEA